MVRKAMYQKIQKLRKKCISKSEISRRLGLDIKTVSKYYSMDSDSYLETYNKSMRRSKLLDIYKEEILSVYERNENKKLNIASVYDYLEEKHGKLPATEKSLRNYISYLIKTSQLEINEKIRMYLKVPELKPGKQMQLDFGEYRCQSGLKLYIFATLLSSSRFKYAALQDRPFTTADVIEHLLNCFDYIGGIPEELVIDQDKLMVVSENRGDILYTKNFRVFVEEMNLSMYVCRKADPESKGKIENLIKYIKYNFFNTRDYSLPGDAQAGLNKWLERRANGKICQATRQVPSVMIEYERQALRPLKNSIFRKNSFIHRERRQVNDKGVISVDASQYQVPVKYRNQEVEIYHSETQLFVFDGYTGKEIAEYTLSLLPGKIVSRAEYRRMTEITAKELKKQVKELYNNALWDEFTGYNFKSFPRYVRDQCIEALKYFFPDNIAHNVLDKALAYCIENKTFSFANLNDTYKHFFSESSASETGNKTKVRPVSVSPVHQAVSVSKRDIETYKNIIN